MAQPARHFPDYATGLRAAVEEEYVGEGFFEALADYQDGPAREALILMAEIERALAVAMTPAVHRSGLQIRDPESLRADGRAEAETLRDTTWPDFLDRIIADYPVFLAEFQQIAQLAPP